MVQQFYQTRVIDEYVLLGNSVVLKCLVPSFVADFVQVVGWVDDNGNHIGSIVDKQGTYDLTHNCYDWSSLYMVVNVNGLKYFSYSIIFIFNYYFWNRNFCTINFIKFSCWTIVSASCEWRVCIERKHSNIKMHSAQFYWGLSRNYRMGFRVWRIVRYESIC